MSQNFCLRLPSSERVKSIEDRFAPSIDRSFNDAIFNAINGLVGTIIGMIIGRKV